MFFMKKKTIENIERWKEEKYHVIPVHKPVLIFESVSFQTCSIISKPVDMFMLYECFRIAPRGEEE